MYNCSASLTCLDSTPTIYNICNLFLRYPLWVLGDNSPNMNRSERSYRIFLETPADVDVGCLKWLQNGQLVTLMRRSWDSKSYKLRFSNHDLKHPLFSQGAWLNQQLQSFVLWTYPRVENFLFGAVVWIACKFNIALRQPPLVWIYICTNIVYTKFYLNKVYPTATSLCGFCKWVRSPSCVFLIYKAKFWTQIGSVNLRNIVLEILKSANSFLFYPVEFLEHLSSLLVLYGCHLTLKAACFCEG